MKIFLMEDILYSSGVAEDNGRGCRRVVRVDIHGCVYEEEADDYLNALLRELAGRLAGRYDYADVLKNPLFRHRLGRFLVDNEGSKRVTIHVPLTNGSVAAYPLTQLSATNGHFEDSLHLEIPCTHGDATDREQGLPVVEPPNNGVPPINERDKA